MPKLKMKSSIWSVEIDFQDGSSDLYKSDSKSCRDYFRTIVGSTFDRHSYALREIRLYDNRHVLYKRYTQNY